MRVFVFILLYHERGAQDLSEDVSRTAVGANYHLACRRKLLTPSLPLQECSC